MNNGLKVCGHINHSYFCQYWLLLLQYTGPYRTCLVDDVLLSLTSMEKLFNALSPSCQTQMRSVCVAMGGASECGDKLKACSLISGEFKEFFIPLTIQNMIKMFTESLFIAPKKKAWVHKFFFLHRCFFFNLTDVAKIAPALGLR